MRSFHINFPKWLIIHVSISCIIIFFIFYQHSLPFVILLTANLTAVGWFFMAVFICVSLVTMMFIHLLDCSVSAFEKCLFRSCCTLKTVYLFSVLWSKLIQFHIDFEYLCLIRWMVCRYVFQLHSLNLQTASCFLCCVEIREFDVIVCSFVLLFLLTVL